MIVLLLIAQILFHAGFERADTSHDSFPEPSLPKPARGQSYVDPVFGSRIIRLTDARADGAAGYVCYYAKLDPFNADESKIIFYRHQVGHWLLYDVASNTYSRLPQIFNPQTDPQSRWHPTDPKRLRFFQTNKIVELNIETGLVSILAEFPGYEFITNHDEGNWSRDGNRLAICGRNWPWPTGLSEFFVYDFAQGRILSPKVVATGHNVDWVSISPLGKYFVTLTEGDQTAQTPAPFQWVGLDVYFAETMALRPLSFYWYTDHADMAIDANSYEVFITDNAEDDYPDRLRHLEKYDLETGAKTDLLGLDWSMTQYVSGRAFNSPGWALITTEVKPELCGKAVAFQDEIFLLKLDGSGDVRRLAQHRSSRYSKCDYSYNNYWDQANGVISKSGNWVLFTSNWREQGAPQDIYLIDLRSSNRVDTGKQIPKSFELRAYPNPFIVSTEITMPVNSTMEIFDMLGRKILFKEIRSGKFNFAPQIAGIYFVLVHHANQTMSLKISKI